MTKGHNTNRMFFWKALSPIQIFSKSGALYVKEKNIILTVKKIQSYSRIVKGANRDRCSIYQRERVVNNHLRIAPEKGFAEKNSSKFMKQGMFLSFWSELQSVPGYHHTKNREVIESHIW